MPVRTTPHRQRRAPIPIPRERPVDVVGQPVTETPVLDVLGIHKAGAVVGRHVVGGNHKVGLRDVDQFERTPVLYAFEAASRHRSEHLCFFAEHRAEQWFSDYECAPLCARHHISNIWMHGDRGVGDQGPTAWFSTPAGPLRSGPLIH